MTFDFGDIQNTDIDSSHTNTITAVYQVVALNVSANTNDRSQTNSAQFFYDNTSTSASTTVEIVVPHMEVTKTVDNPTADAGDIVTYTLTIKHASDTGADAFNVTLSDVVPAGVTYVPGRLTFPERFERPGSNSSHSVDRNDTNPRVVRLFHHSATSVLSFQGRVVDDNIAAFQTVINTARIHYTTLPERAPRRFRSTTRIPWNAPGIPPILAARQTT